jgi:Mg-chelatase subunit ChlI
LPDHLVDLLLDTAVSGRNLVEREGLHYSHAARFILIGTMNPEEGELRPQFLDRFGLCVTISGLKDVSLRSKIVMQRLAYDRDPKSFFNNFRDQERILQQQLLAAKDLLEDVRIPDEIVDRAVAIATAANVQGHRAELALVRAARALAALLERNRVTMADLAEVAGFVLAHRFTGPSFLTQDEMAVKIAQLLTDQGFKKTVVHATTAAVEGHSDLTISDNMDFPGSAAAGSMLFTYLKKKLKIVTSAPTTPST